MTVTLSGLNTNAAYTIVTYDAGNTYGQGATLGGALTGAAPGNLTYLTLNLGDDCLENTNIVTDNSGNVTFTVSPPAGQSVGVLNDLQIVRQQSMPAPTMSSSFIAGSGSIPGQFVLTWSGRTLLQATILAGPWTPTGATSPYTNSPMAPQMFFRVTNP
jgi:hypothetical protein